MAQRRSIGGQPEDLAVESGFTLTRLRWLIRLRWIALSGILVAAGLGFWGAYPGVNWPVLAGAGVAGCLYNLVMWRRQRSGAASTGRRAAIGQALSDFLLLTLVLWAAGGVQSPFISYYVFHVALVGILGGPRVTGVAAGGALACVGFLMLADATPWLRIGVWDPTGFWDELASVVAFVTTLGAVAYLVTHAAGELRDRERALRRAQESAELEYELLSNTLNELDAGLEVLDGEHRVVWKNRLARELVPWSREGGDWSCPGVNNNCERDVSGMCPIRKSAELGQAGRCRFAYQRDGSERLYELHSFPLSTETRGGPRIMNLYLDRTAATLAERQLLLAERLASLGRIAQGVAHELNTPLATIRTLAVDMSEALSSAQLGSGAEMDRMLKDVSESASLIREETGRLGRITQALLAGGDLVRARVGGSVPLAAVVERASALVFAGVRKGAEVKVDASVANVRLVVDPDRLVQVLVNLLQNAHDAVRTQGSGTVVVRTLPGEDGAVCIIVEDDGPGLDRAIEAHLFEPFTTTKPPGEGTGLGLYTSYMLMQAMDGSLELQGRSEGGTRAIVRVPLSRERLPVHNSSAG